MLKEGLLKENIDGEAIYWAYNRLKKRMYIKIYKQFFVYSVIRSKQFLLKWILLN